ncbi:MAG: TetR/AcrR family transcriptional regulator [Polyangiales bacterium]
MDTSKKECILVEAAKAFARFGFRKASIDEIAKEAGVGKGTVYLAAESKEDLYYQVLHREIRAWQAECARAIDPRTSADELLGTLLALSIQRLVTRPLVTELLQGETFKLLPNWAERLADLRALGRQNVVEVLKLGVRQGVFASDLEIETVAALLQDFQLSAWIARPSGDQHDIVHRAKVGLKLVLDGLRSRAAPVPALP